MPTVMYCMATPSRSLFFLFLCLAAVLAMASPYPYPCECPRENETRLHLYLHQFPFWDNVTNPNERYMVNSSTGFGNMYADDWFLTIGPDPFEKAVARAEGFHILTNPAASRWYSSHIILFEDGRFAGSTLDVLGLIVPSGGTWSIAGGTGIFANAHGTVTYKDIPSTVTSITDLVKELDIHVFYSPGTPTGVKYTAAI